MLVKYQAMNYYTATIIIAEIQIQACITMYLSQLYSYLIGTMCYKVIKCNYMLASSIKRKNVFFSQENRLYIGPGVLQTFST